jgi:uncharacterized repeat protein (TIGR03803 family)
MGDRRDDEAVGGPLDDDMFCRTLPPPAPRAPIRSRRCVAWAFVLVLGIAMLEPARAAAAPGTFNGGSLVSLGTFDKATTGSEPLGPVIMDASGNLFGATNGGSPQHGGTVFEVAAGTSGITVLAEFSFGGGSTTGWDVEGGLALDGDGNLFGSANAGGTSGKGTVFELAAGNSVITPLAQMPGVFNHPQTLIIDATGNLFGEATSGGNIPGRNSGYVFEVAKGSNTVTTLASFDLTAGGGSGGALLMDADGDLFGTTTGDTLSGFPGVVFELPHGGSAITTIAQFGGPGGGFSGNGDLVMDDAGDIFGTTSAGGTSGDGTIFEVVKGSGSVTVLASFDGANGKRPTAGLVRDAAGNFFGTTSQGGDSNDGTLFELAAGSNTITTLVSFNAATGARPLAPLIIDANGNLFGTTSTGGNAAGDGTVFAFGNLTVRPGGGGGGGGGGSCSSISTCLAALDAARPSPAGASNHKDRKVAVELGKLAERAGKSIDKAGSESPKKQKKSYRKARTALRKLLAVATTANGKGTLGVSLMPIETAGNALLGLLPS